MIETSLPCWPIGKRPKPSVLSPCGPTCGCWNHLSNTSLCSILMLLLWAPRDLHILCLCSRCLEGASTPRRVFFHPLLNSWNVTPFNRPWLKANTTGWSTNTYYELPVCQALPQALWIQQWIKPLSPTFSIRIISHSPASPQWCAMALIYTLHNSLLCAVWVFGEKGTMSPLPLYFLCLAKSLTH